MENLRTPKTLFLVKEEENPALIHLLPAGLAGVCFFASACGRRRWLVVEQTTSSVKSRIRHPK
jgi:hypothetical protein